MAKSMKMLRGMPDCFHTKMRSVALFFACFGLTFGRYLYWGWQYYPQLDDVVQYGLRETLPMSRWQFILDYGLLKTRPMAGIGDVFVWSKMYGDLVIALFLLTLLFVLSAFLFAKLFSRHFGTSVVFAVIYLLIPINMEGAWWISASSRIVPGLFFTALSACLLQEYIDGGKKRYLWCYFPAALLSMMFYEQCLVLSVAVSFLVLLLNFRYQRRAFWGVGILLCAMIYFVFTEMQPDSVTYSGRMELIWPWSPHYFDVFFPDIRSQIQNVLVNGTVLTYAKGFWRGIQMIIGSPNFLWLFLIALLSAVLAWFFYLPKKKKRGTVYGIFFGFLLALAPISIFFVIGGTPWFSCRCIVPALPGFALMADSLLLWLLRRNQSVLRVLVVVFACGACIAAVSEIHDYAETSAADARISKLIAEEVDAESVKVLNVDPSYLSDVNFMHHEHIHGVTESAWALAGNVQYYSGRKTEVVPLSLLNGDYYEAWNAETNRIGPHDAVYFYDNEHNALIPLVIESVTVSAADGSQRLRLCDEEGKYYMDAVQTDIRGWVEYQ